MNNPQDILNELMDTYGDAVWQYVYSQVRDFHVAQDLSQEVFISAFRSLGQFRGNATVKTWLFTIARNKCRDYFRSSFVKKMVPRSEPRHSSLEDSGVEEKILQHEQYHEVLHELFSLDRKYREIVYLHVHMGMTFREIAQALGISESTVKTRYRRALGKLRDQVKGGDAR